MPNRKFVLRNSGMHDTWLKVKTEVRSRPFFVSEGAAPAPTPAFEELTTVVEFTFL